MSDHGIKIADLVVGQRYRVALTDCCIEGWFAGAFVEAVYDDGDLDEVRFDNGAIGPGWGQRTLAEAGLENTPEETR